MSIATTPVIKRPAISVDVEINETKLFGRLSQLLMLFLIGMIFMTCLAIPWWQINIWICILIGICLSIIATLLIVSISAINDLITNK